MAWLKTTEDTTRSYKFPLTAIHVIVSRDFISINCADFERCSRNLRQSGTKKCIIIDKYYLCTE